MAQWVTFAEGEYQVEAAFLLAPSGMALDITHAMITIFTDRQGQRQVKGSGMTRPFVLTEMHEDDESLDLYLNLGSDFVFFMKNLILQSGKVFSPDVTASIHFRPSEPWEAISGDLFHHLRDKARSPESMEI